MYCAACSVQFAVYSLLLGSVKRVVYSVQSSGCNVQCKMCSACTRQSVVCSVQCIECEKE